MAFNFTFTRTQVITFLLTYLILAYFLVFPPAWGSYQFSGHVFEKGTRRPLEGVSVYLRLLAKNEPDQKQSPPEETQTQKTLTDELGVFSFMIPWDGQLRVSLRVSGFHPWDENLDWEEGDSPHFFYLEKYTRNFYETIIVGKTQTPEPTRKTIQAQEFQILPAAKGDPLEAVKNLPGIHRSSRRSEAVIQGSAPKDTQYLIDGHPIPISFHLLGNTSVIFSEAVDQVDYLSAGYPSEYGWALGGIIELKTGNPTRDYLQGGLFADLYQMGGFVQGPFKAKKSSFFLGVRKSYVDFLLKALASKSENLNFTLVPNFVDTTVIYQLDISSQDKFKITGIGSTDSVGFLQKQVSRYDSLSRGEYQYENSFFRWIAQFTRQSSPHQKLLWSLGVGKDWLKFKRGEDKFYQVTHTLTGKTEVERKLGSAWITRFGVETRTRWDFTQTPAQSFNTGLKEPPTESNDSHHELGLYFHNVFEWKSFILSPLQILPGVRVDHFTSTQELLPQPRMGLIFKLNPTLDLFIKSGFYYQPPEPQEVSRNFGNPLLKAPRAKHLALGLQKDFRNEGTKSGFQVQAGGFYRFFDRLIIPTTDQLVKNGALVPENFNNAGVGRAFGFESLLKADLFPLRGWVSYTLSKSTRWDPRQAEYVFQFDQTHHFNLVGSVELPKNWILSTRLQWVSGNPYTPISKGVFDSDSANFIPVRGKLYSKRLNPFFQCDLRIDKKWVYDTWVASMYLEILNVTNRANPEFIVYSYNYSDSGTVSGFPFLPTIGLRVDL